MYFVLFLFLLFCAVHFFEKKFRNAQNFIWHVFICLYEYEKIFICVYHSPYYEMCFIFAHYIFFLLFVNTMGSFWVIFHYLRKQKKRRKRNMCVQCVDCFAWIHMSKCVHSLTSTKSTYHTICLLTLVFTHKSTKKTRYCHIFICCCSGCFR